MKNNQVSHFLFTLPALSAYTLFVMVPLIMAFYYSFFDWDGLNPVMHFIGIKNYLDVLKDFEFKNTIYATFYFTVVTSLIGNVLGIFFAVLLNKKSKLTNFYRSVFFFPQLLSVTVIGFIWQTLLSYNGIFNQVMTKLSLPSVEFFSTQNMALLSLCLIAVWGGLGFSIVIYLAGLQTISKDYYEAASLDGASSWQAFRHITFPLLAAPVTINIIFGLIGGLKQFDLVTVVTGGAPARQTETMAMQQVRQATQDSHFSYGSTLGIYMLVMISILAILLTTYLRKREERTLE